MKLKSQPIAILDAAVAYGASRWVRGVHDDPNWSLKHKYLRPADKLLFFEFMHDLILYDSILLDRSSTRMTGANQSVSNEILDLFGEINATVKDDLLQTRGIASTKDLDPVVASVCQLISEASSDEERLHRINQVQVPWSYQKGIHVDWEIFERASKDWNLSQSLIPFAIYTFRGICYSGYAHNMSATQKLPTVYLASPGRLKGLSAVLSTTEIKSLNYPKNAYADLVSLLGLPSRGYNFSHLRSLALDHWSDLSATLTSQSPRDALNFVLNLRNSEEARKIRREWASRIWGRSLSTSVGMELNQTVSNIGKIDGDLIQIIHAESSS